MTRRAIGIIGHSPRYLRRAGASCIALGCLCIALLADHHVAPAAALSVSAAVMGAWLFERSRRLDEERERLAVLVAEYESDVVGGHF
jgi:hypothetical protein